MKLRHCNDAILRIYMYVPWYVARWQGQLSVGADLFADVAYFVIA